MKLMIAADIHGSVSVPKDGSHSCMNYENGTFRFHIWEE